MVEAIAHLINRDYTEIGQDFIIRDFIPPGTDTTPIAPALARIYIHSKEASHELYFNAPIRTIVPNWQYGSDSDWPPSTIHPSTESQNLDMDKDTVKGQESLLGRGTHLPPRVALEHVDPHVRLQAIAVLWKEENSCNGSQFGTDGQNIHQALLRCFLMDEVPAVVVASARGLRDMLISSNGFAIDTLELGQGAVEGFQK
jgi:hypothetical protein